jgi:hypothetical protein
LRSRTLRTVAVFPKTLAAWGVGTLRAAVVAIEPRPRGLTILTLARVGFARTRIRLPGIGLLARRLRAIGFTGIRPLVTIASVGLASQAALGELLFRTSRDAGSALGFVAAGGPFTPAARARIVFIVIAGHE